MVETVRAEERARGKSLTFGEGTEEAGWGSGRCCQGALV